MPKLKIPEIAFVFLEVNEHLIPVKLLDAFF